MTLKDRINFIVRGPVMRGLRNHLRRIVPNDSIERKLMMPVLETERLVLRKLNSDDLPDLIAWEKFPGVQNTEVDARELLDYCFREYRERGIGPWGMQLKETGVIVGNCGFPHIVFKNLCAEVNYYVCPRHRGQGLAPEATKVLLEFGFGEIGLRRIQARCDTENLSSERVMLKLEMKFEGLIEDSPSSRDGSHKQKLYAILKKDFKPSATEGKKCG